MKKILSIIFLLLLLTGCSITNGAQTAEADKEPTVKQAKARNGFPLTTEAAQEMAAYLVNETHFTLSQIVLNAGEDPSYSLKLERLYEVKNYVTESFFSNYISPEFYLCFEENCPAEQELPLPIYLGLRYEVVPLSENNYQFSTTFPRLTDFNSSSFRQSLSIVLENGSWKIDSFSNKEEDLNLQESELENYLMTHISEPIEDIEFAGTRQINGVEEEIYQFKDSYTKRQFEVIMRTGQINEIGKKLDLNAIYADDYTDVASDDYSLLFDDYTIFSDNISSSSKEVQNFLRRDKELDSSLTPPYSEESREQLNELHRSYNDLLSDVIDYYSQFYPSVDGANELDQFFTSWYDRRSQYFEEAGVDMNVLEGYDIHYIMQDIYMVRQQIYKVMLIFTTT